VGRYEIYKTAHIEEGKYYVRSRNKILQADGAVSALVGFHNNLLKKKTAHLAFLYND